MFGSTSRRATKSGTAAVPQSRARRRGTLKPWREVVSPHRDVASGRYQQAEFAADLWQVHIGEGSDEYRKPVEFFRRTYLTESLKQLLMGAVRTTLRSKAAIRSSSCRPTSAAARPTRCWPCITCFRALAPSDCWAVDIVMKEAGVSRDTCGPARRTGRQQDLHRATR